MEEISDEALFKEVQNGKKQALEVIVKRYYKNIFRYIYSKINDYYVAQDLCQETFCKVYEKRNTYSNEYLFKPWLYKIAYNALVDYTRSKSYSKRNDITPLDDNIKDKNNVIEYKFFSNNIDDLVEDLSETQKEVVKLRFCEELSIEDIAAVTESNVNTVKSRLYQGIKSLKNKFNYKKRGDLNESKVK